MTGLLPKPARLRQRRNRTPGTATLVEGDRLGQLPNLPKREDGQPWHPRTRTFWRDIQRSPMVGEYVQIDLDGLILLADLVEQYWRTGDVKLAAEIRLQRVCFGLTPVDRRRLQWEVQRGEAKTNASARIPELERGDPRFMLHAVVHDEADVSR